MGKFETTMSIRGEVTVPFPVREALKLRPGDTVIFDQDEAGRVLLRAQPGLDRERAVKVSDLSSMPAIGLAALFAQRILTNNNTLHRLLTQSVS